jgi:hypothetical protein
MCGERSLHYPLLKRRSGIYEGNMTDLKRKEKKKKNRRYNPLKTFDVNPVGETICKEKGIDTIHEHKIYY